MKNNRAIVLLLIANSISGITQGINMLAIPWYFTGMLKNGELFGQMYFVITCLSLVWGLYAGTIVDKYSRKHIFLAINIIGFSLLSSITLFGFSQGNLTWPLVGSVFAITAFIYNIHFPNLYAFAQEITDKKDYNKVTSLLEVQGQFTFAIAGWLAVNLLDGIDHKLNLFGFYVNTGFTMRPWKIYEIFALDACTYILALIMIYKINTLPVVNRVPDTSALFDRLKTGFSFLKKKMFLFHFGNASLLVFLTILITGTYVGPVYVANYLKENGGVYAASDMMFSIGALLAGFLTNYVFAKNKEVRGIIILSLISALMYAFMTFNKLTVLFYAANFILGCCNSAIRIQRVTYIFSHTPNHVIGRANSIFFMLNVLLRLLFIGLFTVPFFHAADNIRWAMMIMGGVCAFGAVILLSLYKKLDVVATD